MNPQKIGAFLKELRKEKNLTQEQFAEHLGVSGRTVSRWETGSNMPDISLLVEIADYYEIDVRELIEGERKSENMDKEVREVATKMADYANAEKSKLLRVIQIISFIGVIFSLLLVYIQANNYKQNEFNGISLSISIILLLAMAIITLYVTGLLEKIFKHTKMVKVIKIATIVAIVIALLRILILVAAVGFLLAGVFIEKPEVHEDVENYRQYMSFEITKDNKWHKCGMDETIWPQDITDSMNVKDYKMVYYNPWDAQFLGYMVVDYSDKEYEKEVDRLKSYESTDYVGYYGVKEETTYQLLAINADDYQGFVYALTDGKNRIIYAEEIFCNYFMDLEYNKYIPKEYLLDGFNAENNNPYQKEHLRKVGRGE